MFSVCGLLCRFLRGWRQSEAVNFMAQAAVLSDGSLLVEATQLESGTGKKENISMFCQPFCGIPETREVQLIWRDNNKQASIISPKEKIDLLRWTLCLYHSGIQSCPTSVSSTPLNSTPASRRNSDFPEGSENIITVLLEATYREKGEESLYGYDVNVEQLAEPYAWKSKDIFGIIIKTTPKKLVSMIHAFFNNALIIDEDLSIRKIITVDLVGEIGESVLGDPATISDNVSPGPWSCKQGNLSQMKLSRLINAFPPEVIVNVANSAPPIETQPSNCKDSEPVSNNCLLLQAAKISSQSQSSEEDGSFDYDPSPFQLPQLCPRGWAISGLNSNACHHSNHKIVSSQPSIGKIKSTNTQELDLSGKENLELITQPSIIANPLNELLSCKETSYSNSNILGSDKEKRVTFALSDLSTSTEDTDPTSHQCSKFIKTKDNEGRNKKDRKIPHTSSFKRQTASFHGRENYFKQRENASENNYLNDNFYSEPKLHKYPIKMKSEADLLKATTIIRDNLANIIENYLTKSPKVQRKQNMSYTDGINKEKGLESDLDICDKVQNCSLNPIQELKYECNQKNSSNCTFPDSIPNSINDVKNSDHVLHRTSVQLDSSVVPQLHASNCNKKVTKQNNICSSLDITSVDSTKTDETVQLDDLTTEDYIAKGAYFSTSDHDVVQLETKHISKLPKKNFFHQDSTESEMADCSFSEDSLNDKGFVGMSVEQPTFKPAPFETTEMNNYTSSEKVINKSKIHDFGFIRGNNKTNNSFSDASTESNSVNLAKQGICENPVLLVLSTTNDNSSEVTDFSPDSLEKKNCKKNQIDFDDANNVNIKEALNLAANSTSLEDNSFSEDSLASEFPSALEVTNLDPDSASPSMFEISDSNPPVESCVSTPDDFSIKSDTQESPSSSTFPLHWHEEYVNLFSNVNQAMSLETAEINQNSKESLSNALEPINELDTLSKDSSSPIEVVEDYSAIAKSDIESLDSIVPLVDCSADAYNESNADEDALRYSIRNCHEANLLNFNISSETQYEGLSGTICENNSIKQDASIYYPNTSHTLDDEKPCKTFSLVLESEQICIEEIEGSNKITHSILPQDSFSIHSKSKEFYLHRPVPDEFPCNKNYVLNSSEDQKEIIPTGDFENLLELDKFNTEESHGTVCNKKSNSIENNDSQDLLDPLSNESSLHQNNLKFNSENYSKASIDISDELTTIDSNKIIDCYSYFNRDISIEKDDETNISKNTFDINLGQHYDNDFLSHIPSTDISPYFQQDDNYALSSVATAVLSPVDSAPESGFASLKDGSHSDGTSESGSVVPISKSKDSLEMTDSEKIPGTDALSDDFDSYSTVTGEHAQCGSNPGSVPSSARGSLMDVNGWQTNEFLFGSNKKLAIVDIENVFIPTQLTNSTFLPSNISSIKRHKYTKAISLDPESLTYEKGSDNINFIDLETNLSVANEKIVIDNSEKIQKGELRKSGSEESESHALKTSDSISSSDTIISKVSFEEQSKTIANMKNDDHIIKKENFTDEDHVTISQIDLSEGVTPPELFDDTQVKSNDCSSIEESTSNIKCISLIGDFIPLTSDHTGSYDPLSKHKSIPKIAKERDNHILSKQELSKCKVYSSLQDDQNNLIKEQNKAFLQTSKSCETSDQHHMKNEILEINELRDQSQNHAKENRRNRLLKKYQLHLREIDLNADNFDPPIKKNDDKHSSSTVIHFHSEGDLGKPTSKSFQKVESKYKTKSITSFHNSNSTSSGEFMYDKASLKSQDSLDKFTHFEAISARPKPRSVPRKKVLSVDVDSIIKDKVDSIQRSITLPVPTLINSKDEKKRQKEEKSKKKKKDKESDGAERKSTLLSLKGFLMKSKSKEKEKDTTKKKPSTSPSLFRKLEKKAKGVSLSPQNGEKKKSLSSSVIEKIIGEPKPKSTSLISDKLSDIDINDKTHLIGNGSPVVREGVTRMGIKSTLHRSNALANNSSYSGVENENITRQSDFDSSKPSPHLRKMGVNDSPVLYKKVLLRNLSTSQESLDVSINSYKSSYSSLIAPTNCEVGENINIVPGRDFVSPVPVMGTKALRSTPKSFSVTIGFKPKVDSVVQDAPAKKKRTSSVGADLHQKSGPVTPNRSGASSVASSLTKRSSSMEILVYGKIREHNPSRRMSNSGCSREGSFKLHREISVETLFEIPEGGPDSSIKGNENYHDYLHRIQASRDSRQGSTWSLCENDESLSTSLPPDPLSINPHYATLPPLSSHSPLNKKFSLPYNVHLSGLGNEISNSNPNLSGVSSPFVRGMPLSSSFTSSPFRRPHSVASNFSPGRRGFNTQGTNITTPDESSPATPLVEVDEEFEPVRVNTDNQNLRPPNVLVYTANNVPYYDSVKETLENSFNKDRYVVYHLTNDMAFKSPWAGNTTLLVICGDVASHVSTTFIRYLLDGGRVLSICSDFLNVAVPLFGTVEVQEASVVSMSYSRWKNVQLLHHQHCFHSSPKHKRFSKDLEKKHSNSGSAVSVEPTYVEITDEYGIHHRLDLTVLAKDDTWGAPSLLVANVNDGKGKALFSQVHLEKNPNQCIAVDLTGEQLKRCNEARLEILRDLLHTHLGLDTTIELNKDIFYTSAYLLGRHEHKQRFLEDVKPFVSNGEFARLNLTLKFQKENIGEKRTFKGNLPDKKPSKEYLPVLMTAYPNNFSTVKYFEALKTETIGRLAIYCDTLSSTMDILSGKHLLSNGMVVITSQQTGGKGRQGNLWLSPLGCAMFSIQLHIPLTSKMGQCLPFLQHLVALSIVLAVKGTEGYEHIPLALKWPNDIYLNSDTKIGGIIVEASTQKGYVIANIGCGVNLSNSNPTTCINDAIRIYNEERCTMLLEFERETFYAKVFNNIEQLLEDYQTKGADAVMQKYYKHWLHGNACVTVVNEMGQSEKATIIGIDHYGFLVARLQSSEIINLHPDGNSFNMMDGLIFTKIPRS